MAFVSQFAILKKKLAYPGFRSMELSGGWTLNYHEKLNVWLHPRGGVLLLGCAWQVMPGKPSPEEELAALAPGSGGEISDEQILTHEETWCGRYVIVAGSRVFLDTAGLLPVFRSEKGISSDLTLLALETGLEEKVYTPGKIMDWMPGPLTQYPGIDRVLNSQIYDFASGQLTPRRLLPASRVPAADEEQRIALFAEYFQTGLRNMQARFPDRKILLALTGGYDSRALFALANSAGLDFDAYTLEYEGIYSDDVTLPGELCGLTGKKHRYIPRDPARYSAELEQAYVRHTAGLIHDADRLSYAHGQYQQLIKEYGDVILLRGSIWETAVEFYGKSFDEKGPDRNFYNYFCIREKSVEKKSLEAYFDWWARHPQDGLGACDAFYWGQRAGCWLSAIEAGFDLLEHAVSLQPLNCRFLVALLLGFPRQERITKRHQAKIIAAACPEIKDVPFAGSKKTNDTAYTILRHKLGRLTYRLKTRGLQNTLRLYRDMASGKR